MRRLMLAMLFLTIAGCDAPSYDKPRRIQIDGHDYYEIGMGDHVRTVNDHECRKCRTELLKHFEELAEPVK